MGNGPARRLAAIPIFGARRLHRGFQLAFASWSDRVLLAALTIIAVAALARRPEVAAQLGGSAPAWIVACVALGLATGCGAGARMSRLAESSVVASAANWRPGALTASLLWPFGAASLCWTVAYAVRAVPPASTGLLSTSLLAGHLVGWRGHGVATWFKELPSRSAGGGRRRSRGATTGADRSCRLDALLPASALLRRGGSVIAPTFVGISSSVLAGAASHHFGVTGAAVPVATALPLAATRVSPDVCRFTSYLGLPLARVVAGHLAPFACLLPASLLGATALALFHVSSWWLPMEVGAGAGLAAAVVAWRVCHYRQRSRTGARVAMQVEAAAALAAAALLPPLALGVAALRVRHLIRRDRANLRRIPA